MAKIIGAIATSHTPTIGFAKDRHLENDPVWKPIFDAYEPIRAWLAEKRADVLFTIYNDHITSFFFDHYSPFALGVDDLYRPADEGGGVRNVPPLLGAPDLARSIASSLFAEEFDISFFRGKPVDHGCFSPLSMLADPDGTWPWKVLPFQVGAHESDSCRVCRTRRFRRRRGHHVADYARRSDRSNSQAPPHVLPPLHDGNRHRDLRE